MTEGMIKGFFFDLDGTLVDTHHANFEAYRQALADFGVGLGFEEFKKSIGQQAQTFLPWFAPGMRLEQYEEIAQKKKGYYKKVAHLSVLNRPLFDFISMVKPGRVIALVTTAKRENALTILRHHHLDGLFNEVVTAEDVLVSKPSPEAYRVALQRTGLDPGEVLAFEDSQPGIDSAEAAGIAVIEIKDFQL